MVRKTDAEVVQEVGERIDVAIRQNRGQERIIVVLLVMLFVSGLGLVVWGAATKAWSLLAPGGLLQLAIVFPLRRLIKLREDNMRLQILPQLLRLADSQEAKLLAAKLVNRLIEQV